MPFSFLYLSQILDSPVLDRTRGRRLGRVADVSADITKIYPNLTGLWVRPVWGQTQFFLPSGCLEIPESGRPILATLPENPSLIFFSTRGGKSYWEAPYRPDSCLIFGSEGAGLPDWMYEKYADRLYRIPMWSERVRSLNLSTAAGIVLGGVAADRLR